MEKEEIIEQADDLFYETIMPALFDDFGFEDFKEAKMAIKHLISKLKDIKEEDLFF